MRLKVDAIACHTRKVARKAPGWAVRVKQRKHRDSGALGLDANHFPGLEIKLNDEPPASKMNALPNARATIKGQPMASGDAVNRARPFTGCTGDLGLLWSSWSRI